MKFFIGNTSKWTGPSCNSLYFAMKVTSVPVKREQGPCIFT